MIYDDNLGFINHITLIEMRRSFLQTKKYKTRKNALMALKISSVIHLIRQ